MDQVGGVNTRLSRNHTRIQGWIPLPILEWSCYYGILFRRDHFLTFLIDHFPTFFLSPRIMQSNPYYVPLIPMSRLILPLPSTTIGRLFMQLPVFIVPRSHIKAKAKFNSIYPTLGIQWT
jgi:hypothetical protein